MTYIYMYIIYICTHVSYVIWAWKISSSNVCYYTLEMCLFYYYLITLVWKYAFNPSLQPDTRFQIYELKVHK